MRRRDHGTRAAWCVQLPWSMELAEALRSVAQALATLVEGVGVAVVAVAILLALWRYAGSLVLVRRATPFPPESLRLDLGRSLALALEFLLGADILRTAVEPTWEEIARLAAIAAIRTGLNYFLQRELASEAKRTKSTSERADPM